MFLQHCEVRLALLLATNTLSLGIGMAAHEFGATWIDEHGNEWREDYGEWWCGAVDEAHQTRLREQYADRAIREFDFGGGGRRRKYYIAHKFYRTDPGPCITATEEPLSDAEVVELAPHCMCAICRSSNYVTFGCRCCEGCLWSGSMASRAIIREARRLKEDGVVPPQRPPYKCHVPCAIL